MSGVQSVSGAELLRGAATILRDRAEAATPGPWRVCAEGSEGSRIAPAHGTLREQSRFIGILNGRVQPEDGQNARYIATMHPGVGLALADWLAQEADDATEREADGHTMGPRWPGLVLARLIVGEQS